jgi:hypothetical protein
LSSRDSELSGDLRRFKRRLVAARAPAEAAPSEAG